MTPKQVNPPESVGAPAPATGGGDYRSFAGCLKMLLLLGVVVGAMAGVTAILSTAMK